MGVAAHDLLGDGGHRVVDGELALVGGDLRVQHHLEKHVAELISQLGDVVFLYGVDRLVGLLHHVLRDGPVGLLAIPRAPIGRTQDGDHVNELVKPVAHGSPCRSRLEWKRQIYLVELVLLLASFEEPFRSSTKMSIFAFLRSSLRNFWYASARRCWTMIWVI